MSAQLPRIQSKDETFNRWQVQAQKVLQAALSNPVNSSILLTNIALVTGSNSVSHKLNKPLTGWVIVRKRAVSDIFDTQDSNPTPSLTLLLTASANVTVDILVY